MLVSYIRPVAKWLLPLTTFLAYRAYRLVQQEADAIRDFSSSDWTEMLFNTLAKNTSVGVTFEDFEQLCGGTGFMKGRALTDAMCQNTSACNDEAQNDIYLEACAKIRAKLSSDSNSELSGGINREGFADLLRGLNSASLQALVEHAVGTLSTNSYGALLRSAVCVTCFLLVATISLLYVAVVKYVFLLDVDLLSYSDEMFVRGVALGFLVRLGRSNLFSTIFVISGSAVPAFISIACLDEASKLWAVTFRMARNRTEVSSLLPMRQLEASCCGYWKQLIVPNFLNLVVGGACLGCSFWLCGCVDVFLSAAALVPADVSQWGAICISQCIPIDAVTGAVSAFWFSRSLWVPVQQNDQAVVLSLPPLTGIGKVAYLRAWLPAVIFKAGVLMVQCSIIDCDFARGAHTEFTDHVQIFVVHLAVAVFPIVVWGRKIRAARDARSSATNSNEEMESFHERGEVSILQDVDTSSHGSVARIGDEERPGYTELA